MIQHLLLVLVAPPLLLLGIPRTSARLLEPRGSPGSKRMLSRPPVAWLLGIGTLWIWHLPVLYAATLATSGSTSPST